MIHKKSVFVEISIDKGLISASQPIDPVTTPSKKHTQHLQIGVKYWLTELGLYFFQSIV